jgi:hypothetical protein
MTRMRLASRCIRNPASFLPSSNAQIKTTRMPFRVIAVTIVAATLRTSNRSCTKWRTATRSSNTNSPEGCPMRKPRFVRARWPWIHRIRAFRNAFRLRSH